MNFIKVGAVCINLDQVTSMELLDRVLYGGGEECLPRRIAIQFTHPDTSYTIDNPEEVDALLRFMLETAREIENEPGREEEKSA